jgi:hypothetical protein
MLQVNCGTAGVNFDLVELFSEHYLSNLLCIQSIRVDRINPCFLKLDFGASSAVLAASTPQAAATFA